MKPIEFGDYSLLKKLAAGGMGEVFLARQERGAGFERYVAIKRILPELSDDDEFVRMFLDEARLAARLSHPNVVQIYDLGICGDQYYIAMEFLEGRDLRRVMGRLATYHRALPGAHAIQIIYGAAEGLHYAHHLKDAYGKPLNIIHRDVSPQNIFVSFHGTVKVLDFGIAKAEARSVRTRTGGLKGKYPYLSPEQVRGEAVDHRSDIFSLGTVLWEVTVGRRLFKRENDLLTLQAVLRCEIPLPSSLMNKYPPELEAIVMKALARDPDQRYEHCRAFQEDLEQFMGQYGLVLSPQKLGDSVSRTFSDEPRTVQEVLDYLKEKPRSQSLLGGEREPSDSVSRSVPPDTGREVTEPSGPSEQLDLLSLARAAAEEDSDSGSGVVRVSEPSHSSEASITNQTIDEGTPSGIMPAGQIERRETSALDLPSARPVAEDWDAVSADFPFAPASLDFDDPLALSNEERGSGQEQGEPEALREEQGDEEVYIPPLPATNIERPDTATDSKPLMSPLRPARPTSPLASAPDRDSDHLDELLDSAPLDLGPGDTVDAPLPPEPEPELEPPTSREQVSEAPEESSHTAPSAEVQQVISAGKAMGQAWTPDVSVSSTESAMQVISRVPTVITRVEKSSSSDGESEGTPSQVELPGPRVIGDSDPTLMAEIAEDAVTRMLEDIPADPGPASRVPEQLDPLPGASPPPLFEPVREPSSPPVLEPPTERPSRESSEGVIVQPTGLEVLWQGLRKRPLLVPIVLLLAFSLPFIVTISVASFSRGCDSGSPAVSEPSSPLHPPAAVDAGVSEGTPGVDVAASAIPPSESLRATDGGGPTKAAPAASRENDESWVIDGQRGRDASPPPSASPPRGPRPAQVSISTVPEKLVVRVDGRRLGTSPVEATLPPGKHRVSVRGASHGIDYSTNIDLSEGEDGQELIQVPRGELALRVRPYADVYIDGRGHGLTPMPAVKLYAGRHRVRLVNDSLGRSVVRVVKVRPGQRVLLDVDMTSAP